MKDVGGRPAIFKTPEEFDAKVDEFFAQCKKDGEHVTITGLCLYLGFESRQSFYDYEKRDGFSYSVKRARLMVENRYEATALNTKTQTFHIFALKNLGWSDKQEIDHTTKGEKVGETKIVFT